MNICPKCERELRNPNQWHYCAKVNIIDLFKEKDPELEYVFDRLLSEITEWENVAVSTTKNCIVFVHGKTFLIIKHMKTQLDLKFYSEKEQVEFPIIKSVLWNSKFENHIRIAKLEELNTRIYNLIKKSYEISK